MTNWIGDEVGVSCKRLRGPELRRSGRRNGQLCANEAHGQSMLGTLHSFNKKDLLSNSTGQVFGRCVLVSGTHVIFMVLWERQTIKILMWCGS